MLPVQVIDMWSNSQRIHPVLNVLFSRVSPVVKDITTVTSGVSFGRLLSTLYAFPYF